MYQRGYEVRELLAGVEVALSRPLAGQVRLEVEPWRYLEYEIELFALEELLAAEQHYPLYTLVQREGVAVQLVADFSQPRPVQFDELLLFLVDGEVENLGRDLDLVREVALSSAGAAGSLG
jgi:hypothetical protein